MPMSMNIYGIFLDGHLVQVGRCRASNPGAMWRMRLRYPDRATCRFLAVNVETIAELQRLEGRFRKQIGALPEFGDPVQRVATDPVGSKNGSVVYVPGRTARGFTWFPVLAQSVTQHQRNPEKPANPLESNMVQLDRLDVVRGVPNAGQIGTESPEKQRLVAAAKALPSSSSRKRRL